MRKSMKKLIALTLTCLMLATLFVGCGSKDEGGGSDGDVIKLGWMGSLTGDQAAFGTCESQTVQMLVDDLNANGGLLGKQVDLICYDTKGDAQEAVNVAKRLCAQDKVCAIIGPNASGQCIAIQSVLDQYKISDMSTVATNEKVTVQIVDDTPVLKEYNFRVCFIDPVQGRIAASFIADYLGYDKAAILYDVNDDYAQGLKDNFISVYTSKGGTVVAEEGYTAGDTDFTAQLTKIKEAQPQIIFTPIFYQDYNGAKMELNGYMAHDAFLTWVAAVEKAGSDDPQAITDAYTQITVEGLTGTIKISPEDHNPVDKAGCVERIDGANKTYIFETKIA